jgi:hypothetical protein
MDHLEGPEVVFQGVPHQDGLCSHQLQEAGLHLCQAGGHIPQQLLRYARLVGEVVCDPVAGPHQLIVHNLYPPTPSVHVLGLEANLPGQATGIIEDNIEEPEPPLYTRI